MSLPAFTSLSAEDSAQLKTQLLALRSAIVSDKTTIDTQAAKITSLEEALATAVSGLKTIRTQILIESGALSDRSFREEVVSRLKDLREEFEKIREASSTKRPGVPAEDEMKTDGADSSSTSDDSPLSNASRYLAAARELESARDEKSRLLNDEFAAAFAGDFGRKFIRDFADDLKVTPDYLSTFIAFLSKYIDDQLRSVLNGDAAPKQVVFLGADADTRAYRLIGLPDGLTFYYVDRAAVIKHRESVLASASTSSKVVNVAADLSTAAWTEALSGAGFDKSASTVFVCEGKLAYLTLPQIEAAIGQVKSVAAEGSHFIGDLPNKKNVSLEALHIIWDKYAEPVKTGVDEPEELFGKFGFKAANIEILGAGVTNYNDRAPPHFAEHMAAEKRGKDDKIPRILVFDMST
jgi:methyltransferase (TIGR00027 family)